MKNNDNKSKDDRKKSFFARLLDKLDKKMEEKAKSLPCCPKPLDKGGNSCCS